MFSTCIIFAVEMKEMQFTAIVLTVLMTGVLVFLLPGRVTDDRVTNRSRWLMALAFILTGLQFFLQFTTGLRASSVSRAVALNLLIFTPCTVLFSTCVLNLQRQGRIRRREWIFGGIACLLNAVILAVGWFLPHRLMECDMVASSVFALLQAYYAVLISRELMRLRAMLANYYDRDPDSLVNWMSISIVALLALALILPVAIFSSGWPLAVYAVFFITAIFYLWFCFVRYVISSASRRVREAEEEEQQEMKTQTAEPATTSNDAVKSPELKEGENVAIEHWVAQGKYLRHDLKSADVARELGIPRTHLLAWVKASGYESFTQWMTTLRINEAKRMLREHPDFTVEAIADHCGISRTHFHTVFKRATGHSPTNYPSKT